MYNAGCAGQKRGIILQILDCKEHREIQSRVCLVPKKLWGEDGEGKAYQVQVRMTRRKVSYIFKVIVCIHIALLKLIAIYSSFRL